jgi:uncharacterized membrane protein
MKKSFTFAAVYLVVAAGVGMKPAPTAAATSPRPIANEVRGIFAAKCAICHGPDVEHPKCRFGYVLDLGRVAANPEMVIPSSPEESELWTLVSRSEMPPNESPNGPLTAEQKETVQAWIKSGAPGAIAADKSAAPSEKADQDPEPTSAKVESISFHRPLTWLGKFHLLYIHFPIALVLAAAAGELWSIYRKRTSLSDAVRYCLSLAAISAVPTAALGWLFAATSFGESAPRLLAAHRWFGTTAAALLVLTALCAERDARRGMRSRRFRVLLLLAALATALTAHVGGLMAHGSDFFSF